MTNTINVPRELLENIVLCYNEGDFELGTLAAELRALLSATSPAGVDGLELDRNEAYQECPDSGCDWGSFWQGWKARHAGAQAIIDGLRGEVERLQFSLEVAKTDELSAAVYAETESIKHSLWDAEKECDQHARRIGELEGLLRSCLPALSDGGCAALANRIAATLRRTL